MLIIVDFGLGNVGSIENMLKKIGAEAIISSDVKDINRADKLIISGVGAFDKAVENLEKLNLISVIRNRFEQKVPLLGICLGMQLFTKESQEGNLPGFGFLDAQTIKFDFPANEERLKIPHMGWNLIHQQKPSRLFDNAQQEPRFYFVHSYHVVCNKPEDILSTTHHGIDFVSSFEKDNLLGVQFHPEKSHKFGMQVLKNFVEKY